MNTRTRYVIHITDEHGNLVEPADLPEKVRFVMLDWLKGAPGDTEPGPTVTSRCKPVEPDYRNNIVKMLDQQRAKGLAKYGETLEQNDTLTRAQRIEHAQEEALDLLQYLEHLKQCYTDHMTVADYERAALRTVNPENVDKFDGHGLIFEAVTGLNEEAGECSGIIKKHVFQGHELDREHLAEELGDVAWYLVLCCKAVGLKFEDVLQMNNTKRAERYPEGFDKARSINREQ